MKMGIDLPPESMDDPKWETWNWQKFLETAQALTTDEDGDGENEIWGISVGTWWAHWLPFVWSNGGELISSDWKTAKLDSREFIEAMDFYAGLITKYEVAPSSGRTRFVEGGVEALFKAGKIAMVVDNGWKMRTYFNSPLGFVVGWAPIPWGKKEMKDKDFQIQCSSQISISANAEHPEIVWDMISLFYNSETQKIWHESVYKSALAIPGASELAYWEEVNSRPDSIVQTSPASGNVNLRLYRQILERSRPGPWTFAWPEIEHAMAPVLDVIFNGDKTSAEVLPDLNKEIQALLDEWEK